MSNISKYIKLQNVAKNVLNNISLFIKPDSTEESIVKNIIELFKAEGVNETWYHNTPALVLLGNRSCLSISGKDYRPANESVGHFNMVTIDVSPMKEYVWGDCARSYFIEKGNCTSQPISLIFKEGKKMLDILHHRMKNFVKPSTRFSDLFKFANAQIELNGFINLDFMNNLGHSIETQLFKRHFIDQSCHERIGRKLFTFEPHIKKKGTNWGFKHEDIYYFDNNNVLNTL
jgi:hypothetical protein